MPPSSGAVASPPCDEVRDRVFELLDDELSDEEAARLRGHVVACAPCRALVERERRFLRALRRPRAAPRAPASLRARVRRELERVASPPADA